MTDIKNFSSVAASNNLSPPDGFPEGQAASTYNNSARELMAAIRRQHEQAEWIDFGDVPTYISTTSFTVPNNRTSFYQVGRRIRISDSSTLYGTITASVFTSLTTVTVALDSGSISVSISAVAAGLASVTNPSIPTGSIANLNRVNNFRLTPTSGAPVVTGDANAITTLYMTPYNGDQIALYDGTKWNVRTSAEISISLASTTAGLGYDVFCYYNSGTPALELTAWTNSTTRATALVYQNGVLVRSGATTRRYLGSFYCHTNGQTASSLTNTGATTGRYIFNYYNRVLLRMQRFESTASWAYNTGSYRQANGSTINQLNFFIGVVEDAVACSQTGLANIASANALAATAIGLNSTTAIQSGSASVLNSMVINYATYGSSTIAATPSLGLNYLAWLEFGVPAGTTFFGSAYPSGINGAIFC